MPEPAKTAPTLTAIRYDVSRWTVAQGLAPFSILASIAARRIPNGVTIAIAVALLAANLVAFARARHNLGKQTLHAEGGKLRLQASGEELSRKTAGRWTLRAGVARLHGSRTSYKFKLDESCRAETEELLVQALGAPTPTSRRGSPRARALAGGVLALGVAALGLAVGLQYLPLLFVGVPAVVVGGATFGALSQRVMR